MKRPETSIIGADVPDQTRLRVREPVKDLDEFLESLAVHHCRLDRQTDQYADHDARTTKISDRDADAGNGTEREAVDAGSLSRLISQGAYTTSCWDQRRRLLPTGRH